MANGNHDKPNGSHYAQNNNSRRKIEKEKLEAEAAPSSTTTKTLASVAKDEQKTTNHQLNTNDANTIIDACQLDTNNSQLMGVKRGDRSKFFGSLPILDSDEICEENCKLFAKYLVCSIQLFANHILFTF